MDTESELSLIERLRNGDTSALGPLMDLHAARVYRVAHGITRNEADAEEVVQDVFLSLVRKIHGFEGRAALSSWLYRVTTNAALMKRRGKRAEVEVALEDFLPRFIADGHRAGDRAYVLADWSHTPEQELLSRETGALVQEALDDLPEHYRAVLVLRDVEGLSSEAAAEALGESVASVKSRLHRARMVLRERLTQSLGPVRHGAPVPPREAARPTSRACLAT
jgi:RNA polymerase sigma-70 factor, ECF subfamily